MPKTYPNQKWVKIHKTELTKDFLSIPNEEWMTANKTLKPYGLQPYTNIDLLWEQHDKIHILLDNLLSESHKPFAF